MRFFLRIQSPVNGGLSYEHRCKVVDLCGWTRREHFAPELQSAMIFEVDVIREPEINREDVGVCMAEGGGTVVGRGWQFEHVAWDGYHGRFLHSLLMEHRLRGTIQRGNGKVG